MKLYSPETYVVQPWVSDWLKAAYAAAIKRDPVDALHDAQTLADLIADHFKLARVTA